MTVRTVLVAAAAAAVTLLAAGCGSSQPASQAATGPSTSAASTHASQPPATPSSSAAGSTAESSSAPAASGNSASSASASAPNDSAAAPSSAQLPDAIRQQGNIRVGTQFGFAPFDYYLSDGKTPAGFEVELMTMVAQRLGTKIQWIDSSFSAMIPGLLADRYDAYINLAAETAPRRKQVDFVDYLSGGTGYMFRVDNPRNIKTELDLCGATVVAPQGTSGSQETVDALTAKCKAAGKSAVTLNLLSSDNACVLAVQSKRADAYETSILSLGYIAKQANGTLSTIPTDGPTNMYGMLFKKGNVELETAISDAINAAIQDGSYAALLDKYGFGAQGVQQATVRPATG